MHDAVMAADFADSECEENMSIHIFILEEGECQMVLENKRLEKEEKTPDLAWLDDPEVEEWNFDKIAEDQDFYVNEDGHIVVCFNEYDVAPGSMGCVEFTLNETVNVK